MSGNTVPSYYESGGREFESCPVRQNSNQISALVVHKSFIIASSALLRGSGAVFYVTDNLAKTGVVFEALQKAEPPHDLSDE
jgi:hypothetical protein